MFADSFRIFVFKLDFIIVSSTLEFFVSMYWRFTYLRSYLHQYIFNL